MAISMSSAGIVFPATHANSTNANTLDDFEEGHTTDPTIRGSGNQTQASRSGNGLYYVKVGKSVCCNWEVQITSINSGTGTLEVALPFSAIEYGAFAVRLYSVTFNPDYIQAMATQSNYSWLGAQQYVSGAASQHLLATGYWFSGWNYMAPYGQNFP